MFCIKAQKTNDLSKVAVMLDEAFGVDRMNKTAYRLRDGILPLSELSFVGRIDGHMKATLQFWPVLIKGEGDTLDALLLGPIAVAEDCRGQGFGLKLMRHGLDRARELGHSRVILVGDESYYKKVGFSRDLARGLELPGPVDKSRLLAQELVSESLKGVKGMVSKI